MPKSTQSGQNCVFKATISSRFAKRLSYGTISHWCSLLKIDLNLSEPPKMGSYLIIVIKLYRYKDSDVGNIRKIKYFHDYNILDPHIRREIRFK